MDPLSIAMFVAFGLLIGTLFGFFGMGGTFLVTPLLLILGYPASVAVGSGMAFVFGTAVIAALKHRELGQVDYRLGISMIVGTAVGIEAGKEIVLALQELGLASGILGVAYVGLLGAVGVFTLLDARNRRRRGPSTPNGPTLAERIQAVKIPPMLNLRGGISISLWAALAVGFATGLLSGFLGVGGGFIRMPALIYFIGMPVPIAVGTDLFEIIFSGGIGTFLYAGAGGVNLGIVMPLLAGSALGAQLGAAATRIVDADSIKSVFGWMLMGGATAVAVRQIGSALNNPTLETVSMGLIFASALFVTGVIAVKVARALRATEPSSNAEASTRGGTP